MSERTNRTEADRRLTAEELAASIREGLEARDWRLVHPTPAFPPPELDPTRCMPAVSNLTTVPIPTHPGIKGWVVRAARRALGRLFKPWAEQQSWCNELVAHLMYHQSVQLARRGDEAVARLQERVDELTRLYFEAARRLDERDARAAGGGR